MLKQACLVASLMLSGVSFAQEQLFSDIDPPSPDVTPPPTAFAVYASQVNDAGIRENPDTIVVSIPRDSGTLTATLQRQQFIARSGFDSEDQSPSPGAPASAFAFFWTGLGDGYNLRLTFRHGRVAGILEGPVGRFEIQTDRTLELNKVAFPADDSAGNDAPFTVAGKRTEALATDRSIAGAKASSGPNDIDILVLYTEEARVAAGGPAGQCVQPSDTAASAPSSTKPCWIRTRLSQTASTRLGWAMSLLCDSSGFPPRTEIRLTRGTTR